MKGNDYYKLTLVTNKKATPLDQYLKFVYACAKSGITCVQLREKNLHPDELLEFGTQLLSLLQPFSIPLIINDNADLAYRLNADGVHLGQSDGNVSEIRERLGDDKIIGLSINSIAQLHAANTLPIDYVGVGAIFPTNNKKNITTIWGCDGLKQIASLSNHVVIAIGGINDSNVSDVIKAGAHGVAAIAVFHDATDPSLTTNKLHDLIENNIND